MGEHMNELRTWFDALPEDALEDIDSMEGGDTIWFDQNVEEVLRLMSYGNDPCAPGCEDMVWSASRDGDTVIVGWDIGVSVPEGFSVTQYIEWTDMVNPALAGRDWAWDVVTTAAATVRAAASLVARMA